ncbi:MAG: hypothetical protein H8F28_15590, partial [Fibrella sp.]|nr:hypothetical protein [Armatimonadota bacterium]
MKNKIVVTLCSIFLIIAIHVAITGGKIGIHRILHSQQISKLDAMKANLTRFKSKLDVLQQNLDSKETEVKILEQETNKKEKPLKGNVSDIKRMKAEIASIESKYRNDGAPGNVYSDYRLLLSKHNALVNENNALLEKHNVVIRNYNSHLD